MARISGLLMVLAMLVGSTGSAAPTLAAAPLVVAQAGAVSLDQAAAKVRRVSGGKVVSADTVEQDGGSVYRIKVVFPDGRVRIYFVDPNTGEIQN